MFNKKTKLVVEFENDKPPVVKISYSKKVDPSTVSNFINNLLLRNWLGDFLSILEEESRRQGVGSFGRQIVQEVDEVQTEVLMRFKRGNRDPIIKPSEVFQEVNNEEVN